MDTVNSSTELFRIFLLEDDPGLCADLQAILERRLPGTRVVTASTIEKALEILAQQNGFTLGILDIRVPWCRGMQPDAHSDVAERLKQSRVACLFMTGFSESPDVEAFLQKRSLADPPVAVVEKRTTPGYLTGELVRHTRAWFTRQASGKITTSIYDLFGPAPTGAARSGTARLIEVKHDILAYWAYLDDAAQNLVRRWFVVREEAGDNVVLSLIHGD